MLNAEAETAVAKQKRKQYAFQNSRSYSAPLRKRKWWYRKAPLRQMGGSQQSLNYDRMVSRRLIGAIAAWHDIHSNLLQLTLDQKDEDRNVAGSSLPHSPRRTRQESMISSTSAASSTSSSEPSTASCFSPPTSSNSSTPSTTKSTPNTGQKFSEEKRQSRGKERLELFADKNQTISLLQQHHSTKHHHLGTGEGHSSKWSVNKPVIRNPSYFPSSTPNSPEGHNRCSPSHLQASSKFNWNANSESKLAQRVSDRSDGSEEEESDIESDYDTLISEELLDEIVELEKKSNSSKFSMSNPELTSGQLKAMFPELSDHWRKALAKSPVVKRAAAIQEQEQKRVCKHRTSRYWLEEIDPHEHIWLPSSGLGSTSNSTDTECYIGEKDCEKVGDKRRCAACHIVAHTACFPLLSKMNLGCKTTFRDCAVNSSYRHLSKENWDVLNKHHWVHRWKMEGRCHQCGKIYQQKMFRDKEVIAITCSWCKKSYHNKRSCFSSACFEEKCDRGVLRDMMLPPSWMLRLSNNRKRLASKNGCSTKASMGSKGVIIASLPGKKTKRKYRPFVVKSMDQSITVPTQPLLVFVNPKSGGNKGCKALHTLCWLLNPRQVFDITAMKGPKWGLEVFRKISTQLRILVAGGDGTVGWVLSALDQLNWPTYPPMALLPLGTGNDLARCMGWGGVFSDEPLAELLSAVLTDTTVTYLDRWHLNVQPNTSNIAVIESSNDEQLSDSVRQESSLPLTVMNNYFSIGADAHVALQFHHSRSANPQMLNSRLKNRIAYGGLGTIDLFKRTWKDLSEFLTIECDDVDITSKIREFKFHCVLFHNISFYAGGTMPWGSDSSDEYSRPSCCDQKIEVIGFTTATLAALQMGAKGERIAQCSKVRIESTKAIPMQVDGEPCLLAPSIIKLHFHSKVPMLRREKKMLSTPHSNHRRVSAKTSKANLDFNAFNTSVFMHVPVIVVGRHDYDMYRDCIDRLKDTAFEVGVVSIEAELDLLNSRQLIHKLLVDHPMLPYEPSKEWRFLDYISNSEEGIFRISRYHEHSHSISDICNLDECIIILDEAFPSITARSAQIANDFAFTPAKNSAKQNALTRRRISETLRIVLSSDSQETHL